jgi:hypothetical protein
MPVLADVLPVLPVLRLIEFDFVIEDSGLLILPEPDLVEDLLGVLLDEFVFGARLLL